MTDAEGWEKVENSHNLFANDVYLISSFPGVIRYGIDLISLLISIKVGHLLQKHLKALKNELLHKVNNQLSIESG